MGILRRAASAALVAALALAGSTRVPAQSPAPPPEPAPERQEPGADTDDVTQLSVTLVQIDAVVVDDKGRPVTDLRPEEFEIFEDGRPQQITGFSYVSGDRPGDAAAVETPAPAPPRRGAAAPPAAEVPAAKVRRTVAFLVDDLFLSAENVVSVKRAMRKFVEEQMQPGDLVAVIQTGRSAGALQQFTSDKRQLLAAIDAVRWNPRGVAGASAFRPPNDALETRPAFQGNEAGRGRGGRSLSQHRDQQNRRSVAEAERARSQAVAISMLTTLGETVEGLDELPGRKSVVLFSEGFRVLSNEFVRTYETGGEADSRALSVDAFGNTTRGRGGEGLLAYLRYVVDRANRAAVSIHAVDPRGVVDPSFASAEYGTVYMDRTRRDQILGAQRDEYFASQTALHYLADQTGGEVTSSNDPSYGVGRAVDGLGSYYSIAYVPEGTFDAPAFHEITVRVKRPGLRVRARSGFFGVTDAELRRRASLADRVMSALTSPFGAAEIDVRLASQFVAADAGEPSIRAVLHVDGADVSLAKGADGTSRATVNVFALVFGENGAVAAKAEKTQTLTLGDAEAARFRDEGYVFVMNIPVKKPGAYRVRAAVRDAATDRIGSASQFVEVPDVKSGGLALSGILLATAERGDSGAGALSRRFRRGSELRYAFIVYNAKAGREGPRLATRVAIWRDGKPAFEGPFEPLALKPQRAWNRINVAGGVKLSDRIAPGTYQLQISVADGLAGEGRAGEGRAAADEWIDFEVVP